MRKHITALAAIFALGACATSGDAVSVHAVRETAPVDATGDAADDPAIWVAANPAESLVIATQKQGGLYVFDLSGAVVQQIPGGRPNNVDIREGFAWREGAAPIVGAGDRSDNTLVLWRFDPAARRLESQARVRLATGFVEVYGFCLGRMGNDTIAIATDKGGEVGVWRLSLDANSVPVGQRIAQFSLGSITEGCVIDDARGVYYLADELRGIWRLDLTDATGANKRLIDNVSREGHLAADVEGLTIWHGPGDTGYLIASAQGRSRYAVYNRGDNAYRGSFRIGASLDGGADAVSGTDGIDIVSAPLGPDYPRGMFVAQDDENTAPRALQNFKYVSWAEVATALGLE